MQNFFVNEGKKKFLPFLYEAKDFGSDKPTDFLAVSTDSVICIATGYLTENLEVGV
jgi:hypothetical protein